MGSWWKILVVLTGGIICMGGFLASTHAQGPLANLFQKGPDKKGPPQEDFTLPDRGEPNAFTTLMDVRPRHSGPITPPGLRFWSSLRPGIFAPTITPAVPAEFPNAASPSTDPISPWTERSEGMPNAWNELADPRPRPLMGTFHGARRLVTEMLEPEPQVVPPYVLSFRGEFLRWRPSAGTSNAVLLTTNANPNLASFGQLGDPNTAILVNQGASIFNYGNMPGYRLTANLASGFLPPIEASGFWFNRTSTPFSGGSLANPTQTLSIPYQDIQPAAIIPGTNVGTETALVVALPVGSGVGALGGTVNISSTMDFWGVEAFAMLPLGCSDVLKVDALLGYRHLTMNESLTVSTASGGPVGSVIFQNFALPQGLFQVSSVDSFSTTNTFDGGLIGLRGVLTNARWSLYADAKVGLGVSNHTLAIGGSSTLTYLLDPSQSTTVNGGVLALGTNSGSLNLRIPALTSEFNAALSFQVTANLRAYVGYNLLYWSTVGRPGDFISHQIDGRQIPTSANFTPNITYAGPTLPTNLTHRDFITQGIFFGIELGF